MEQVTSHILMVRPAHFGFNTETAENNVFQGQVSLSHDEIQAKAVLEFDLFVQQLRDIGIEIIVVEDTENPIKPDAVFPNNWFCTLHDGSFYLFPMFAPNRRLERRPDIIAMLQTDFNIAKVEDWSDFEKENGILEGTGSVVFDHLNKQLFACLSPRTNEMLVEKFAKQLGYKPIIFTAEDEQGLLIYHTNVMMHIGIDYAVICLDTIHDKNEKEEVLECLAMNERKIVVISLEQMHQYAGNMLQVKNNLGQLFTILSKAALRCLSEIQKSIIQESSKLMPMDIGVIETVGGGSARCMMAEIFLSKKIKK
ncbi:MAG: amidinotransferase [Pseudopedobacter saltans]|uniref:Amidinotransferase n=1 Tax=Pseudopedobacter saltans TaxID=151895 RepID=A0A2W5F2F4_9SPHI|nr:MAG: amidinotransferase [Pseudopedobacter saltans]